MNSRSCDNPARAPPKPKPLALELDRGNGAPVRSSPAAPTPTAASMLAWSGSRSGGDADILMRQAESGALRRQGRRRRRALLRAPPHGRSARAAGDGDRPAARVGARRIRSAISAAGRLDRSPDVWRRGAGALAHGRGRGAARPLHSAGREDRAHRADRRVGAAARRRAHESLARRRSQARRARHQHLAAPVRAARRLRAHRRYSQRNRVAVRQGRDRDHGKRADGAEGGGCETRGSCGRWACAWRSTTSAPAIPRSPISRISRSTN